MRGRPALYVTALILCPLRTDRRSLVNRNIYGTILGNRAGATYSVFGLSWVVLLTTGLMSSVIFPNVLNFQQRRSRMFLILSTEYSRTSPCTLP